MISLPRQTRYWADEPDFVSYRRADDPFGAGLVAAGLRDRFGEEGVFLDTWVLNRRGDPQASLEEGLDASAVVLVLIAGGRGWKRVAGRRVSATGSRGRSAKLLIATSRSSLC